MANSALGDADKNTAAYETANYSTGESGVTVDNEQMNFTTSANPEETADTIDSNYGSAIDQAELDEFSPGTYDVEGTNEMLGETSQYKKGSSYIDKATGTVAGQLESLLNKDNPLMQQAKSRGEVAASKRGQLGASMGIGATQSALYSQGMEIASRDADIYNQAAGRQQQAEYGAVTSEKEAVLSGQIQKHNAELSRKSKDIDNKFQALMKSADAKTQATLTGLQEQYKQDYARLDEQIRTNLMNQEIDAKAKQMAYEQSANILQNYQVTVENMMTNPSFLELGKDAIVNSVNQLQNLATNQVNFIGNAVGVDFTDLIDFYFDDVFTVEDVA